MGEQDIEYGPPISQPNDIGLRDPGSDVRGTTVVTKLSPERQKFRGVKRGIEPR